MPTVDSLDIQISAQAQNAERALSSLVGKLNTLSASLKGINASGLTGLANGVGKLATSMQGMSNVKTTDFTRLATNIQKLANLNTQGLNSSASALSSLTRAFNALGGVSQNAQQVGVLANNLAKLGYKSINNAVANLPALASGLNNLLTTLSMAPAVSNNVIQMTNALANLASQGRSVGSASNSLVNGLNKTTTAATRATKSTKSLAAAFGKFYANFFLLVRGIKGLWNSIESTADYIEAYNYFNVALGKIGSDWSYQYEQYGYANAETYAESFSARLQESLSGLSGIKIEISEDGVGLLTETGLKNLGLNIQEVTQYASQLASVTNSVGQTGEVSLETASAFTKLGADMSSLFNIDYSTAMTNLQSGLIGQSRALYKYGIDITNATLQTYAYELGLEKTVTEMTQAEKMQLRMIAILDQSKVSWGDLANTINSPSNMIRQFTNNLKEAGTVLGQLFIPLLQKVMPIINGVTIAIKRLLVNIAGILGVKIDLDAFGTGYSDLEDDVDGATDSLDGLEESAQKAQSSLRGFDELKTIKIADDITNADDLENTIDLTEEIIAATKEYESVWSEAFANMENKAEEWADKISEFFNLEDISQNIEKLFNSISNFSDSIEPFEKGFGSGFWSYIKSISEIVLTTFTNGLESLSDILGKVPPEDLERLGEALGALVGALVTITAITGISKAFTSLSTGLSALGTTLLAHPILATFSFGVGIYAMLEAEEDYAESNVFFEMSDFIEDTEKIESSIITLKENIDGLKGKFVELDNTELENIYGKWENLNSKVSELTDEEKGLIKAYADRIIELFPEAAEYIDENGRAIEGMADNLRDAIELSVLYAKTIGVEELVSEAAAVEIQAKLTVDSAKKEVDELVQYFKTQNPEWSEEEIIEIAKAYSESNGHIFLSNEKLFTNYSLGSFVDMNNTENRIILEEQKRKTELLSNALENLETAEKELEIAEKTLNEVLEYRIDINNEYKESLENAIGTSEEFSSSLNEVSDSIQISTDKILVLQEEIDKLNKKEIVIPVALSYSRISDLKSNTFSEFSNLQGFWTGGYPNLNEPFVVGEKGPEIMGTMNGKAAIANSDSITSGIEEAAYRGMLKALSEANYGQDTNVNITLEADNSELFKIVKLESQKEYMRTGLNQLVY